MVEDKINTLINTAIGLLRVLKHGNFDSQKQFEGLGDGRKLRILGNGKSLENVCLDRDDTEIDYMVVNRHVLADNYTEIRPRFYTLADPHFFSHPEGVGIIEKIDKQTSWDMTICLPYGSNTKNVYQKYVTNPNIKVCFYNNTCFDGYKAFLYPLYGRQLCMPRTQNVLAGCIMLSIAMNYKIVELYGVEHNWLQNLFVGEDNLVYLSNPHFYDKESVKPKPQKEIQHLDEYPLYLNLTHYARMFQTYWEIKKYVETQNIPIRIVNCTPKSYIDAFERKIES